MVLLRYAGLFIAPCVVLVALALRERMASRVAKALAFCAVLAAVAAPWFVYLRTIDYSPRSLALEGQGVLASVKWGMVPTMWNWIVPKPITSVLPEWWQLKVAGVLLLLLGGVGVAACLRAVRRRGVDGRHGPLPAWCVAFSWMIGYVTFVLIARLVADSNIPFDLRILAPAYILLVLTLLEVPALISHWRPRLNIAMVLWFVVVGVENGRMTLQEAGEVWRDGGGYRSREVLESDVCMWLHSLPDGVTVFSNRADRICANHSVTAKWTPAAGDESRLNEFIGALRRAQPSIVVLYPRERPRLISRKSLIARMPGFPVSECGDTHVVLIGVEPPKSNLDATHQLLEKQKGNEKGDGSL